MPLDLTQRIKSSILKDPSTWINPKVINCLCFIMGCRIYVSYDTNGLSE